MGVVVFFVEVVFGVFIILDKFVKLVFGNFLGVFSNFFTLLRFLVFVFLLIGCFFLDWDLVSIVDFFFLLFFVIGVFVIIFGVLNKFLIVNDLFIELIDLDFLEFFGDFLGVFFGDFIGVVGLLRGDLLLVGDLGDFVVIGVVLVCGDLLRGDLVGVFFSVVGVVLGDFLWDGFFVRGLVGFFFIDLFCFGVLGEVIGFLLVLGDLIFFGFFGERFLVLGDFFGFFVLNGFFFLIGDFWEVVIDFFFKRGFRDLVFVFGFLGVVFFLIGVDGGRVFRKCLGFSFGLNDILVFLDLDFNVFVDFFFFLEFVGVFGNVKIK